MCFFRRGGGGILFYFSLLYVFVFFNKTITPLGYDMITANLVTHTCLIVYLPSLVINQIFPSRDWSKCMNIPQLGNMQVISPKFQNHACCKKYFKDNKHKNRHFSVEVCSWRYLSMNIVVAISCFLCVPFVPYVNVFFHILHVFSRRM